MANKKSNNNKVFKDETSLYSRYSISTLFLKFFVTLLLTNKITKKISLWMVRFILNKKNKFFIRFL
ncbi:hypothetical protein J8V59_23215, partial [Photorhabdus laumondii]|nr:hypothetical protein [Photorhabdus laumondii]